jgi:hypothetical protein
MAVTDDAAEVLAYYPRLRPRLQIVLSCEKVVEKRLFVKVGMALSLVPVNRIGDSREVHRPERYRQHDGNLRQRKESLMATRLTRGGLPAYCFGRIYITHHVLLHNCLAGGVWKQFMPRM